MSTTRPTVEGDKSAANDGFTSRVLEFGCAEPPETAAAMLANLRLHADAWDLAEDLTRDETNIVVLDRLSFEPGHPKSPRAGGK